METKKEVSTSLLPTSKKVFAEQMEIFMACYGIELSEKRLEGMYELLKDISEKRFIEAIKNFCKRVDKIEYGVNLVKMIRENAPGFTIGHNGVVL